MEATGQRWHLGSLSLFSPISMLPSINPTAASAPRHSATAGHASPLSQHTLPVNSENMKAAVLLCGQVSYALLPINAPGADGKSQLHLAAERGDMNEVVRLLGKGANVYMRDDNRHTPPFAAHLNHHTDVVEVLQDWKERLDTALGNAVRLGDLDAVRNYVQNTGPTYQNAVSHLFGSIAHGQVEVTEFLLSCRSYLVEDLEEAINFRSCCMSEGAHLAVGMDRFEAALRRALPK